MHVLQQLLLAYKDASTTPASAERTVGFAMTLRNVLSGSPDLARALSLYVGWPHVVM